MSNLTRYDIEGCSGESGNCHATMESCIDGDYVLFEDAKNENKALRIYQLLYNKGDLARHVIKKAEALKEGKTLRGERNHD